MTISRTEKKETTNSYKCPKKELGFGFVESAGKDTGLVLYNPTLLAGFFQQPKANVQRTPQPDTNLTPNK